MTTERWDELEALFHRAVDLPAAERAALVDDVARRDGALADELATLLAADEGTSAILDAPEDALAMPAEDHWTGRRLGAYELLERVGMGGMGVVHRARRADGLFDHEVAIKFVRGELDDPATRRDFESERRTLARLSHPNIARLLDGGTTDDGRPYLVMELVHGTRIDGFCRERKLSLRARLDLFREVCDAVAEAHRNLVVHRDLKPANILVDDHGRPRLLDFGIAALEGAVATRDDGSSPALTPDYASPEQLAGEPLTTASDVYSLGVLLHELVTGRRPGGDGPRAPGDLAAIVDRALERDPVRRYTSAAELAADVSRSVDHLPVMARPHSAVYVAARFLRRNRAALALTVVAFAGVVAVAIAAQRGAEAAQKESAHARVEADTARDLSDFLVRSLLGGSPTEPLADRSRTLTDVESEAAIARRRYADDPHRLANLLDGLGRVARELDAFETAETLLAEAHALRREAFGDDSLESALSLGSLGELDYERGRPREAVERLERALEIHRAHPGDTHADVARAANDLAVAARAAGDLDRAEALHREALSIRRSDAGSELLVAESLNNLAGVCLERGALADAVAAFDEALSIRTSILGDGHPLTLQAALNLAGPLYALGERDRARALIEQAEAGYRELGGAGAEGLGMALSAQVSLDLAEGRPDQARSRLEEALELRLHTHGAEHPATAALHAKLAELAHATGDAAGARKHWDDALAIQRAALGDEHIAVARTLRARAVQAIERHELPDARADLHAAIEIHTEAGEPDPAELAGCHLCLAMALRLDDDVDRAREAVETAQQLLDTIPGPRPVEDELAARLSAELAMDGSGVDDSP